MNPSAFRFAIMEMTLAIGLVAAGPSAADEPPLPWQPDYAAAVAVAQARHRHMVVLLAAADSEPCRRLEQGLLADPLIREGLADMVWVRVENDPDLERTLGAKEHPTLAFVNPFTGSVLHRCGGQPTVELLARQVVHARRAIGLPLSPGLEPVAKRMFALDESRAAALLAARDPEGLQALLAPAAADDSRLANYLLVACTSPAEIVPDDVRLLAGTDCLVGTRAAASGEPLAGAVADLAESCAEYPLPESLLVLVPVDREKGRDVSVRITAPGCQLLEERIRFAAAPADAGSAVQVRHYEIRRLTAAARLSGRVLRPDGGPAAGAIVRIDDWFPDVGQPAATTRTDDNGRFSFPRMPPGRWLVRAEFPGGEREQVVTVAATGETSCELPLAAVTTVGLRWALQTREFAQDFTGEGVQTGEAFVSVAASRLVLARGTRVRTADSGDIMFAQLPLADDSLPDETRHALAPLPAGTPVWYLFDAAYTEDFRPISGMHREPRPFAKIDTVRPGDPLPATDWAIIGPILPQALAAAREQKSFFQFPRGEPVRVGDVFTLRCASSNCFAKLEVTTVTIVTPPASR